YVYQLDGQWIDITGVADGKYWLQIVDDPQNRLVESNEENNSTKIPIDLHLDDDSRSAAYDVGDLAAPVSYDEFVGEFDANDYYKFTLASPAKVTVSMTGLSNDADLKLLDSSGTQIAKSTLGGNSSETIVRSLNAGTYYVEALD